MREHPSCSHRPGSRSIGLTLLMLLTPLTFLVSASACGDEREEPVPDGTVLSDLSASQRTVLCEQIFAEGDSAEPQSCDSPPDTSVSEGSGPLECEDFPAFTCSATVADFRACWRRAIAEPCLADIELQPECVPLNEPGCNVYIR